MATHSSTLAWKIPWMKNPGRLQSMGLHSRTRLRNFMSRRMTFSSACHVALYIHDVGGRTMKAPLSIFSCKVRKVYLGETNLSLLLCERCLKSPFFSSLAVPLLSSPPLSPSPLPSSSCICGLICDLWYPLNQWALDPDSPCSHPSGSTDSLYNLDWVGFRPHLQ